MRKRLFTVLLLGIILSFTALPAAVSADTATPTPTAAPPVPVAVKAPQLTFYTPYPSQIAGLGETVSVDLRLQVSGTPEAVALGMKDLPQGWSATFHGGTLLINSVYLLPDKESAVELRLAPPSDLKAGTYNFTVTATGTNLNATLPVTLVFQEKLPDKLTFSTDLPTLIGSPTTTFSYTVTLSNDGDSDLSVNLGSDSAGAFQVKFSLNGQDVTTIPLAAKSTKTLSVSASALNPLQAGTYPITITAQGGTAKGSLDLSAQVTGQSSLSLTTPDGRLSGNIDSGAQTPIKVTVKNTGTASARSIALSADTPTGWTATFDPPSIPTLAANQTQDVTVTVKPADKAVAGDYMLTLHATPADGAAQTVDYRATLLTSTLWGVAGIGLVVVAVGVIALAVNRFGRR